jgi:hypothetical protein
MRRQIPQRTDVTDPRHGARSALIIQFAINLLNFFDRNMFGAVAEPIRKEWALNDSQSGGWRPHLFFSTPLWEFPWGASQIVGNRPRILGIGVAVWELANGSFRNGLELRDTIRGQSGSGNRGGKLRPRIEFTHR